MKYVLALMLIIVIAACACIAILFVKLHNTTEELKTIHESLASHKTSIIKISNRDNDAHKIISKLQSKDHDLEYKLDIHEKEIHKLITKIKYDK